MWVSYITIENIFTDFSESIFSAKELQAKLEDTGYDSKLSDYKDCVEKIINLIIGSYLFSSVKTMLLDDEEYRVVKPIISTVCLDLVMKTLKGESEYHLEEDIITDQEFNEVAKMINDAAAHCITCNEVIEENKKVKRQELIISEAATAVFQCAKEVEDELFLSPTDETISCIGKLLDLYVRETMMLKDIIDQDQMENLAKVVTSLLALCLGGVHDVEEMEVTIHTEKKFRKEFRSIVAQTCKAIFQELDVDFDVESDLFKMFLSFTLLFPVEKIDPRDLDDAGMRVTEGDNDGIRVADGETDGVKVTAGAKEEAATAAEGAQDNDKGMPRNDKKPSGAKKKNKSNNNNNNSSANNRNTAPGAAR